MGARRPPVAPPSIIDQMPTGLVWAVDGTASGSADSDTNVPITSLTDIVGASHFDGPATASRRPRSIPADYLCNGRSSILFDNIALGAQQHVYDAVTNNRALWEPMWLFSQGSGATFYIRFMPRGDNGVQEFFGNLLGGSYAGQPGFQLTLTAGQGLQLLIWKAGVGLVVRSAVVGECPLCEWHDVIVTVRNDQNSYIFEINGASTASGNTTSTPAAANMTAPMTIGARTGTDGATRPFGGNIACAMLWHRALDASERAAVLSAAASWYDNPPIAADSGPVAGASVVDDIELAICGTSIDTGANDATGGYPERIYDTIAPGWSDLDVTFVGSSAAYGSGTRDVMAVPGQTIRGVTDLSANGFDSIAPDHALRIDHQLADLNTSGVLASAKPLVMVWPVGWINDLRLLPDLVLDYDHQGDLIRMIARATTTIRGYNANKDVRHVLATCTPSTTTRVNLEIVAANAGTRAMASRVAALTGCPVAVADPYTAVAANTATYMADALHPSTAGHSVIAPLIADAIRHVCGLT
jgi:hypothetical protein